VVRLQLVSPVSAAMHRLLALKKGEEAGTAAALETLDVRNNELCRADSMFSPAMPSKQPSPGLSEEPSRVEETQPTRTG
jgi:hypothetical protein